MDKASFNTASGMRSHVTRMKRLRMSMIMKFQYRKRYEVTCDPVYDALIELRKAGFNTASGMRSHVTVSGRSQKQKAQIRVLENLLETEHAIALFQLSLHTSRVYEYVMTPSNLI